MKRALKTVVAAFLLFAAVSVSAQSTETPKGKGKEAPKTERKDDHKGKHGGESMILKMKDSLKLTDAQVVKIKELDKATFAKLKVEGADKAVIFKEKVAEMKKILTPEQYVKYEAYRKKMEEAHKVAKEKAKAGKSK